VPYLDTNVVVAYYLPEALSGRAQSTYQTHTTHTISELVELEVLAVLSAQIRTRALERTDAERVAGLFLSQVETGMYARVHLHAGHYQTARGFIRRFDLPIKSPDALHLAVCTSESLALVTADRQMARNAESLGLDVYLLTA